MSDQTAYDIPFDVTRMIPRFLLADRNGFALARAIETAMRIMNDTVATSIEETVGAQAGDVESLPEWRLDELAWEYNIPYDYDAAVETKRNWLLLAFRNARMQGTAEGLKRYLAAAFGDATVTEAADYGGDPFHFRVDVSGGWSAEKQAWTLRAVEQNKNVRSVLDALHYAFPDIRFTDQRYAGVGLYGSAVQRFSPTENPDISGDFLTDETDSFLTDENGWLLNDA